MGYVKKIKIDTTIYDIYDARAVHNADANTVATTSKNGLMSSSDKIKLDSIEAISNNTRTDVNQLKQDIAAVQEALIGVSDLIGGDA